MFGIFVHDCSHVYHLAKLDHFVLTPLSPTLVLPQGDQILDWVYAIQESLRYFASNEVHLHLTVDTCQYELNKSSIESVLGCLVFLTHRSLLEYTVTLILNYAYIRYTQQGLVYQPTYHGVDCGRASPKTPANPGAREVGI